MFSIHLTGVQGVGKSTISKELQKTLPSLVFKDYADFMLEASNVCNKDAIEKLHSEERTPIYQRANELLMAFLENNNAEALILESHVSVRIPEGTLISFSPDEFKVLRTKLLIVIEACPDDICRRRAGDQVRARGTENIDSVEQHQLWNRKRVEIICRNLKIPYHIVQNDKLSNCVQRISKIFYDCKLLTLKKSVE